MFGSISILTFTNIISLNNNKGCILLKDQTNIKIEKAVEKYLKSGGTITKCPAYARSENIEYKRKFGRGKKKKE